MKKRAREPAVPRSSRLRTGQEDDLDAGSHIAPDRCDQQRLQDIRTEPEDPVAAES